MPDTRIYQSRLGAGNNSVGRRNAYRGNRVAGGSVFYGDITGATDFADG